MASPDPSLLSLQGTSHQWPVTILSFREFTYHFRVALLVSMGARLPPEFQAPLCGVGLREEWELCRACGRTWARRQACWQGECCLPCTPGSPHLSAFLPRARPTAARGPSSSQPQTTTSISTACVTELPPGAASHQGFGVLRPLSHGVRRTVFHWSPLPPALCRSLASLRLGKLEVFTLELLFLLVTLHGTQGARDRLPGPSCLPPPGGRIHICPHVVQIRRLAPGALPCPEPTFPRPSLLRQGVAALGDSCPGLGSSPTRSDCTPGFNRTGGSHP